MPTLLRRAIHRTGADSEYSAAVRDEAIALVHRLGSMGYLWFRDLLSNLQDATVVLTK